jgi:integrase
MATIRKHRDKWQVQIRRKGNVSVARSFLTKRDAEIWARQTEIQIDRHELPADPRALDGVTLGDLVERYRLTVLPRKRAGDVEDVVLQAFLRHPICARRVSQLTTKDFAAYRDERLKTVQPATLNRQLNPIRHLFTIARKEWRLPIKENPLQDLELDAGDRRRERRLRKGEQDRLIAAAKACRNPLVLSIILFAIETAMRRGEILAIEWDHIDQENRCLIIPETKNGHSRTIPLTAKALALLLEQKGDRPFPMSANGFRLAWERTTKRVGIADLHFHDLRHEAISRYFESGLNTPEVALISGHKDLRMLFRYTHPIRDAILSKLDT